MRLVELTLTRYGPFAALRIALDPAPGRINLLHAPNGAGKSVLRQAFGDLLFGIGGQSPMGFRFGYEGMRLGAVAVAEDASRFGFARRKGRGNTLLDANGEPDSSGRLDRLLGGTDRGLLERLFALDTERLRLGGEDLLRSGGLLSDALLAGSGLRDVKALRQALDEAADAAAPARKSAQKPFYQALDRLADAGRRARAALLRPEAWERAERDLAAAVAARQAHNAATTAANAEIARLERLRRVRAPLAEYDEAAAELARSRAAHPEVPDLPAGLEARLEDAARACEASAQDLMRETALRDERAGECAALTPAAGILAEAAAIKRMDEQAGGGGAGRGAPPRGGGGPGAAPLRPGPGCRAAPGAITGRDERAGGGGRALADLPLRTAELAAQRERLRTILRRLGSSLPPGRAGEAIPDRACESAARHLIARHAALESSHAQAQAAISEARRTILAQQQERAALPAADAAAALLAPLVAEIRAAGDPAACSEAADAACAASAASEASALAAVPGWTGGAAALIALTPPADASLAGRPAPAGAAPAEQRHRRTRVDEAIPQRDAAAGPIWAAAGPSPTSTRLTRPGGGASRAGPWSTAWPSPRPPRPRPNDVLSPARPIWREPMRRRCGRPTRSPTGACASPMRSRG